jgi:hypothetical protein
MATGAAGIEKGTPGVFFIGQKKEPPRVDQLPTSIEATMTEAARRFFQGD